MKVVPFEQFLGSAYKSASVNVAISQLVNWQIENTESATDQSPFPKALFPTPGVSVFVGSLASPIRGVFAQDGRAFCVGGNKLYELQGDGTADVLGSLIADDQPCSFASNGNRGNQLLVVSAGFGYIYNLSSGVFQQIAAAGFPSNAVMCDYIDGYFLVLQATTSKFFVSALENGLLWSPADVGQISSSSDTTLAMKVLARNAWMFGSLRTEIWVDQGGTFPLAPIQPLLEFGIAAIWSLQVCEGTLCFVAQSVTGSAFVLQNQGYGFKKISTSDQDRKLTALPDLANVRAYSYEERGHTFYVICPNTGPAMVYDFSTGLWHDRGVWDPGQETYLPPLQWCHMYAFGKHLVGDRQTGTIYEQSVEIGSDNGMAIRRLRTAPHVNEDQQWVFGSQVTIGAETGLSAGFINPDSGALVTPVLSLSFSTDGGHVFSEPQDASLGALGDYGRQVTWYQTPGRFHDLVLRATTTATTPVRLNSCQLRLEGGTGQR